MIEDWDQDLDETLLTTFGKLDMTVKLYAVSDLSREQALLKCSMLLVTGEFNSDGTFLAENGLTWQFAVLSDADGNKITGTECEKLGYEVGDRFTVCKQHITYSIGQIVTLRRDDGTDCPFFKDADDKRSAIMLTKVTKLVETASTRKGYYVDDLFIFVGDTGYYEQGAQVRLERDDGTACPFFRGVDNDEGFYLGLDEVEPYSEPCNPSTSPNDDSIEATLAVRDGNYGSFDGHAAITQALKAVMQTSENWDGMTDDKKEALEMIQHKIGRILNGNPEYKDSWHDIVGYAKLVDDTLED